MLLSRRGIETSSLAACNWFRVAGPQKHWRRYERSRPRPKGKNVALPMQDYQQECGLTRRRMINNGGYLWTALSRNVSGPTTSDTWCSYVLHGNSDDVSIYRTILSPTKAHWCYRARVKGEYESIRLYSDLIRADIAAESQRSLLHRRLVWCVHLRIYRGCIIKYAICYKL